MDKVCVFFQRGQCRFGTNCKNLHQDVNGGNFSDPRRDDRGPTRNIQIDMTDNFQNNQPNQNKSTGRPKGICNYFLQGKCNSGDTCR